MANGMKWTKDAQAEVEVDMDDAEAEEVNVEGGIGYATEIERHQIQFPTQEKVRYAHVCNLFQPILSKAKNMTQYQYKFIMANGMKWTNAMLSRLATTDASQSDELLAAEIANAPMMQQPPRVNNRYTSTVNHANHAKRKRTKQSMDLSFPKSTATKKKKTITCSACRFYTGTVVLGHRAYTQRCAQVNNPNHIYKPVDAAKARASFQQASQGALSTFNALQSDPRTTGPV